MSLTLFIHLFFLSTLIVQVHATCECKKVTSWENLRSLVIEANERDSLPAEKLLLCPFHIKKVVEKNADYWNGFAPIKKPMHISCQKEKSTDECWIEIEGDKCDYNENCGAQMIKIRSSDVTIEGFKITAANDNVINTDKNLHNIRLIDLSMYKGSVPGNDVLSNGLINVNSGTSMQILNSDFAWNKSIVVENRGHLLIHSSTFSDNKIKTQGVTGGVVSNYGIGDVTITSSSFLNSKLGPAVQSSMKGLVIDAGLNCASGGNQCDGIERKGQGDCTPFLGGACESEII